MRIAELHWSVLSRMSQSPAHVKACYEGQLGQTRPMHRGSLGHAVLLGSPYAVFEGKRRQGKAWDAFAAEHEGELIATLPELEKAQAIANAVRADPIAGPLLVGSRFEVEWATEMHGRKCAGRIDIVGANHVDDLKIVRSAKPARLMNACLWAGHHAQLQWYKWAVHSVGDANIIGVEPEPPYPVTVLRLTPKTLLDGEKLNRLWLERLAVCEASDEWPGYAQTAVDWDIDEAADLIIDDEEAA